MDDFELDLAYLAVAVVEDEDGNVSLRLSQDGISVVLRSEIGTKDEVTGAILRLIVSAAGMHSKLHRRTLRRF